jgi:hypothetical protein
LPSGNGPCLISNQIASPIGAFRLCGFVARDITSRFAQYELAVCSDAMENVMAGIEEQGQSVVVADHKPHAYCVGKVLGIIAVGDTMRPNAP